MTVFPPDFAEISRENYVFLQQHVYRTSGIVLDEHKRYLLEARLLPIVRKENMRTINDLCALLRATGPGRVFQEVAEAMTTNETLFFRDSSPFKIMFECLLPPLIEERKKTRRLTLWSAAASSGQEAYSLAMLLMEAGLEEWKIDILGTDLSEKVLARAREASYTQIEVNRGLSAARLVKYFNRKGLEWQVKDELRNIVRFQTFDLRQSMRSLGPFDFVLCRNVLIYFDTETKKKILREIEGTLHTDGYLLLGAAETTMNLIDSFERCPIEGATFYRKR